MGNPAAPYGFRPVRYKNGSPWNGQVGYYFATGATTQLMVGDPVVVDGSANSSTVTVIGGGEFGPGTLPTVVRATAGDAAKITGIVVGVMAATDDSLVYRANSTDRVLAVVDDENVVFRARISGVAASTDIGTNCNFVVTQSGNETFGTSGIQAEGTFGTTATSQLRFIGAVNDPDVTFAATGNEGLFILNTPSKVHDKTGV